jgi:predicted MFS family arabinose efflux permease
MLILVVPAHTPRGLVLGLSLGLTGFAIVGLSSGDAGIFLLSSALFGLLYPIFPAFQFETIARSSTAAAVTTLTASMIGFSCGPLIAGRLIERFGYSSLHWLAGAGCTVALLTLVPLLRSSRASTLEC